LEPGKALLIFGEEVFIARFLACRKRHHVMQAQVHTNGLGRNGQGVDVFFDQEGDKIAARGIPGDGNSGRFGMLGQGAAPANRQRLLHAGQRQFLAIPSERRRGVLGCLTTMLLLPGPQRSS
jgi:hypothetical protein